MLDSLLARLDAAEPYCTVMPGPPGEGAWFQVEQLGTDPAVLAAALAGATEACAGIGDAGAAYLAGWLGELVAAMPYTALTEFGSTWELRPGELWIRRGPEGWFDGLAVGPGCEVHDDPQRLAADIVAALTPVFAALRRAASFGTRGMWGTTADGIAGGGAYRALRVGGDEGAALDAAHRFVDALAGAGAPRMTRPGRQVVSCTRRDVTVSIKGTCCLWYKTGADEAGHPHYCLACPLEEFEPKLPRWQEWLNGELDALAAASGD